VALVVKRMKKYIDTNQIKISDEDNRVHINSNDSILNFQPLKDKYQVAYDKIFKEKSGINIIVSYI